MIDANAWLSLNERLDMVPLPFAEGESIIFLLYIIEIVVCVLCILLSELLMFASIC